MATTTMRYKPSIPILFNFSAFPPVSNSLFSNSFNFFAFRFQLQNYSYFPRRDVDFNAEFDAYNPKLVLNYVREKCKLGFSKVEYAVPLFNLMNSLRPRPCVVDFNQLFTSMMKIKPFPPFATVISLSRQLHLTGIPPDHHSLGILATCYCRLGYVDLGFSILSRVIKLGFPLNIIIFTTLINGLLRTQCFDHAVCLLDKIVKLGFQPTLVTYGTVFKGLCSVGNNAAALNLLRNMESHGHCMPDVVIYSTIIDSLCKDQLIPQALRLFAEMKAKGVRPNVVTYASLIQGLFSLGHQKGSKEYLTQMLENNITSNADTNSMLINMDGIDAMDEVEKLINLMVKDGCKPNVFIFTTLINGYCKSRKIDKALRLFQEMPLKGISPDVTTYNILIDALCKHGRLACAYQLFKEMKAQGLQPNVVTWNSLIDGLCENAKIDDAMETMKEMEKTGVVPDLYTHNIMINGLCEAGRLEDAVGVFSFLVDKGFQPNVHSYNVMIKGFCKKELLTQAEELYKKMEDEGCSPDDCTYNIIIRGFLYGKDVRRTLDLVRSMRGKGYSADAHTLALFVNLLTGHTLSDPDKVLLQNFFEP